MKPRAAAEALAPRTATPFGELHLRRRSVESGGAPCALALAALALSPEFAGLDTSRLLYLDTETTGLSGGTGTLPFLIGVARLEAAGPFGATPHPENLRLEQLFLPGPGEERPMLEWLRDAVAGASALVTFNGKSFDWPLLRSRYVMNRLPPPPQRPHLDLLHCARRVYRFRLQETRLQSLEAAVLGLRRQGDIDGADIPRAWFDFLRSGRVATLARVLEHNERDLLSMVELLQVLAACWNFERSPQHADALGLAHVAARLGDAERALRFARQAQAGGTQVRAAALELEAELHRRRRDHRAAAAALEEAVQLTARSAKLHLALSKLYEHRLRDLQAAHRHAELATAAEPAVASVRRRARLCGKLAPPADQPLALSLSPSPGRGEEVRTGSRGTGW